MSLQSLLLRGVEPVIGASLSSLLMRTVGGVAGRTGRLTEKILIDVRDAVENRLGKLSPSDRGLVTRLARAIDLAQRIAGRITRGTGRLPYPNEVPRLPGTDEGEGRTFTYVTVVSDPNRDTHRGSSVRVVFTSTRLLTADEVYRASLTAMQRGQYGAEYRSIVRGLEAMPDARVTMLSVYRGTLNVV